MLTGGLAALVNFLSRIFYNQWVSFQWAVILAYVTGMIAAFVLAKAFVFKASAQPLRRSVGFFVLVNLVAVIQTWLVSVGLASYLFPALNFHHHTYELAHAVGVVIPVFTSYLGHKTLSFR